MRAVYFLEITLDSGRGCRLHSCRCSGNGEGLADLEVLNGEIGGLPVPSSDLVHDFDCFLVSTLSHPGRISTLIGKFLMRFIYTGVLLTRIWATQIL